MQFRVRTAPHDLFRREGNDLHTTVTITLVVICSNIFYTFRHCACNSYLIRCSVRRSKLLLVLKKHSNTLMNILQILAPRSTNFLCICMDQSQSIHCGFKLLILYISEYHKAKGSEEIQRRRYAVTPQHEKGRFACHL